MQICTAPFFQLLQFSVPASEALALPQAFPYSDQNNLVETELLDQRQREKADSESFVPSRGINAVNAGIGYRPLASSLIGPYCPNASWQTASFVEPSGGNFWGRKYIQDASSTVLASCVVLR